VKHGHAANGSNPPIAKPLVKKEKTGDAGLFT